MSNAPLATVPRWSSRVEWHEYLQTLPLLKFFRVQNDKRCGGPGRRAVLAARTPYRTSSRWVTANPPTFPPGRPHERRSHRKTIPKRVRCPERSCRRANTPTGWTHDDETRHAVRADRYATGTPRAFRFRACPRGSARTRPPDARHAPPCPAPPCRSAGARNEPWPMHIRWRLRPHTPKGLSLRSAQAPRWPPTPCHPQRRKA